MLSFVLGLLDSVPPWAKSLVAGFAIMLETSIFVGLIMPGDTVVLVASTGVTSWPDFSILLAAVLLGSLIGETIGFSIGRFFGPKLKQSKLGQKIGQKNWDLADRLIEKRGGIAIFISRFIPVLHSVVPAVAGMTTMRYRIFISYTFAACLVWTSMYVGIGFLARSSYEQLSGDLKIAAFVGIGILLVFVGLIAGMKKILQKYAHSHQEEK